jgi:hypothetical protein
MMKAASGKFQRPGRSDADAGQLASIQIIVAQAPNCLAHIIDHRQGARFQASAHSDGFENSELGRIGGDSNAGAPKVDAYC